MEATRNIIFVFSFAQMVKIYPSVSMTFEKRKQIIERLIMFIRREKDVKFAVTPLAVALETLTHQL